jgi:hypothetical protein
MTRQEQAKFKRLEKRHHNLLSALFIIKNCMSFPYDPKDLLYQIAELATKEFEADLLAERKEQERNENSL